MPSIADTLDIILKSCDLIDGRGRNLGPVKGLVLPQGEPMALREAIRKALPAGHTLVAKV